MKKHYYKQNRKHIGDLVVYIGTDPDKRERSGSRPRRLVSIHMHKPSTLRRGFCVYTVNRVDYFFTASQLKRVTKQR